MMSSLTKIACKGTLQQVFIRVYRLEILYSQSCWYFRRSFLNYCPSNLLSGSPLPLPCINVRYIQTVCGWGGGRGC